MKVTAGVEGNPTLTLGDIRRLYHETTLWSDSCGVELFTSDVRQRITIKEVDSDRSSKPNQTAVAAPAARQTNRK